MMCTIDELYAYHLEPADDHSRPARGPGPRVYNDRSMIMINDVREIYRL